MKHFYKETAEDVIKKHKSDFVPNESLREDPLYLKLIRLYNPSKRNDSEIQSEIIANELEGNEPVTVAEVFLRRLLNGDITEKTRGGILDGSIPVTKKCLKLNVLVSYLSGQEYYFEIEKPILVSESADYGIDIKAILGR